MLQWSAPSRTKIKRYHELSDEIDQVLEKINTKHANENWKPIIYIKRYFTPEEILPYYELSDICIVSSLHDGMNLVAKEYVAAKVNMDGVLILSKFTGASKEFTEAVQINPYSIEEFADALQYACAMPKEEKHKRMENMRKIITENNVYKWAADIIANLTALKKP